MKPLVSIIIPTYNRAHLIGETLDSVLAQSYPRWECIVVDDGSSDYTLELVEFYTEKDKRIKVFKRPSSLRKGANSCRNYGFKLSKGNFINWFDSDDIMHPDKLKIQLKALQNSNYNFSVCNTLVFSKSLETLKGLRYDKIISKKPFEDYLQQKIIWLTQAPLWKKDFLKDLPELFNESLSAAQEWEFHCRILNVSPQYQIIEKPLVYLREHEDSISYNSNKNFREWNYFLARSLIYNNDDLILTSISRDYLRKFLLNRFKTMVTEREFRNSFKSFKKYILKEKEFGCYLKLQALFAIVSYKCFNRGYLFLKKIKY